MSLVTRCPACATTFKVVRDQLRISDGWVRCGRCSHVFDATLDLQETPDAVGVAPPPMQQMPPAPAPMPAGTPGTRPDESGVVADDANSPVPPRVEEADFLDDEVGEEAPPPPGAEPMPPVAPAPPPAMDTRESADFAPPAHGIVADEPWSDLEVREPQWRPPPSSLPPFPDIDLDLAAPPSPPPSPAPPLPAVWTRRSNAPAIPSNEKPAGFATLRRSGSDEDSDEDTELERDDADAPEEGDDKDRLQMQKALRRARAKSAKIAASAKARDERGEPEERAKSDDPALLPFASVLDAADETEERAAHRFADEIDDDERDDRPKSFWQRIGKRRGLIALAAIAGLLLVVQVLRHERDGIVARQPSLRPALAALCQAMGCELAPLRRIGDIVIEGAAFAREKSGGNDYRFSFNLRSNAAVPLAMPSIELVLLDTQERAVVRRVLSPADYGAPAVLAARGERVASLPMTLTVTEAAALPPIAGYRVEAFYP
ncbi:hypothetical protein APR52_05795 [Variovorax paradoxus]|jgi:predicted Zn finger-like uncharacterized protein|uniref:zinc-ribbon and DUF3426 domain-containing protein n=6 Tax=Variovorax paradoxus TaxID=34073 RepID=UPI0006E676F6|nr:hypothetical protein APR52_05795 [Variovorax paradoxus]